MALRKIIGAGLMAGMTAQTAAMFEDALARVNTLQVVMSQAVREAEALAEGRGDLDQSPVFRDPQMFVRGALGPPQAATRR